jgi:hypothetical protein
VIRATNDPIALTIIEASNGPVFVEDCDIITNAKFPIGTRYSFNFRLLTVNK